MEEKTEIQIYLEETSVALLNAAKAGIKTLIAEVSRDIGDDLADEKRKSAIESKKKAFMDAQEMMTALASLDRSLKGEPEVEDDLTDRHFKRGAAEKFAK
jgi:hypothetical protein|tara:strand:- start:1927 stop:2226 length:300 start_codon:yes stop_codon:yes gene_type:complete